MRRKITFAAKIAATLAIAAVLWQSADWREVARQASSIDRTALLLALAMFLPQVVVSAWRWRLLMRPLAIFGLKESVRQTLIASALNLVVPGKLGDVGKAAMVADLGATERKHAAFRAVWEKVADVAVLLCGIALGASGKPVWVALAVAVAVVGLVAWERRRLRRGGTKFELTTLVAMTALLWTFHFTQLILFLVACGVNVALPAAMQRMAIAIFAGLVPATFCGIGTRDAALVYLFADVAPASTMAVVGLLTALRYLIPGAAGIPLLWTWRSQQRTEVPKSSTCFEQRFSPTSAEPATEFASRPLTARPATTTVDG